MFNEEKNNESFIISFLTGRKRWGAISSGLSILLTFIINRSGVDFSEWYIYLSGLLIGIFPLIIRESLIRDSFKNHIKKRHFIDRSKEIQSSIKHKFNVNSSISVFVSSTRKSFNRIFQISMDGKAKINIGHYIPLGMSLKQGYLFRMDILSKLEDQENKLEKVSVLRNVPHTIEDISNKVIISFEKDSKVVGILYIKFDQQILEQYISKFLPFLEKNSKYISEFVILTEHWQR